MSKSTREITKSRRAPEAGTPVLVRFQVAPLEQLDNWRRDQTDLPSRAEAIRRLVAIGLSGRKAAALTFAEITKTGRRTAK